MSDEKITPYVASPSGWSLYWVASDGFEDCFVVARNSRSAVRVECEMNGFLPNEVSAKRVLQITRTVEASFKSLTRRKKGYHQWPWYADEWLLSKVGASFREVEERSETLIDDVVYSPGRPARSIGSKAVREFQSIAEIANYGEEDTYSTSQMQIFTMLGLLRSFRASPSGQACFDPSFSA